MDILKIEKYILHITGLLLDDSLKEQKYNRLLNVVLLLPFLPIFYGSIAYLVEEASSVIDFTESTYTITIYLLLGTYYIVFASKKLEMKRLLIDLGKKIATSKGFWCF